MCSVIEVWQAEGLRVSAVVLFVDEFPSGARGRFTDASIGRGRGSGILFEAET